MPVTASGTALGRSPAGIIRAADENIGLDVRPYEAIVVACCDAWIWLTAQPKRITAIGTRVWGMCQSNEAERIRLPGSPPAVDARIRRGAESGMRVIWLNGTIGSGKTTVDQALATVVPGAVFVDGDDCMGRSSSHGRHAGAWRCRA